MARDRDERRLEDELRDLGNHVEYPQTPDLARTVRNRIDEETRRGWFWSRFSSPRLAVAAAIVLVALIPILSPDARQTLGDVFLSAQGGGSAASGDTEGGAIEEQAGAERRAEDQAATPQEASPGTGAETTPMPSSGGRAAAGSAEGQAGSGGDAATGYPVQGGSAAGPARRPTLNEGVMLGEQISLREAHARSDAPILLLESPRLGKPDAAYDRIGTPGFTFLYRTQAGLPALRVPNVGDTEIGLLLTETSGDVGVAYLARGTVKGAGLEKVSVGNGRGYWMPPRRGALEVARDVSPSTGVLLWERDGQALRIEADVTKEEAVRIAESVR